MVGMMEPGVHRWRSWPKLGAHTVHHRCSPRGQKRVRNDLVTKQQQQMLIVINRREGRVHEHGCREVETLWTFSSFCCCCFFFFFGELRDKVVILG